MKLFRIILFLLPTSLFATTYYVTQSGTGSANGSSAANAWSIAQYNSSQVPTGGDTVVFTGTINSTVTPGTNGKGNGASRLTLDFSGATLSGSPSIRISGRSYLNLNGGTFSARSSGTSIDFANVQSHDITIQKWTQNNPDTSTAAFLACYYCYNLEVLNNRITNTAHFIRGDSVLNHDIRIANNYVTTGHNTLEQTDIVFMGDAYNVIIEGNKLVQQTTGHTIERHNDCIQTYRKGGSNAGTPYGWIVRYNWLELDVVGGTGDTSFMMMERMGNVNGVDACKIYGNVFLGAPNDTGSNNGVNFNSNESSAVVRFHNNTVVRKNGPENTVRFLSPGTVHAQNNVGYSTIYVSGTFLSWTMNKGKWDHNVFSGFSAASTYTGPNGSTANPKFADVAKNEFSALDSTSPLRGKGDSSIGSEYAKGIAPGATWPNPQLVARTASNWDIGAYQSGGASQVVAPTSAVINISVR